ncbi:MAG: Eco57I restriction-modification methylase domain-containing protein, partial [Thermoguttaceae bacterium]
MDIGANTGKFTLAALAANDSIELHLVDLPGQLAVADKNLQEAGLRERATLQAFWAFLAKPALCPAAGEPILDRFDASSNKHAVSVSDDLKYAARQVVELFGNEAVRSLRAQHKALYNQDLANKLTRESLIYLYRLLFIFVMEARADRVGYLPMKSEAYRKGYSLESLRDLEMTPMTPESEEGYFFDESVKFLFEHIWSGTETGAEPSPAGRPDAGLLAGDAYVEAGEEKSAKILLANSFRIEPLQCKLFDPERTPTLNGVKFRNSVWQKAIRLLSLTRESNGGGKGKGRKARRRGRISYARLGVSQLGAVYEGLLSYRGFFAETDLYEVKKAGEEPNELEQGFFVPAERLDQFADDERVLDENGRPRVFPKGSFIYRLAGRDRDTSASFYTPDSLTKCLVKYALKELIGEDNPSDPNYKTADEILDLTLCEPAMGSAAFLNEAINQLADAYLRRKQTELDQWIPAERIEVETQKVRTYLADRNVFGADLNPVAVELGEISLWLNSIFAEENPATGAPRLFAPWFERQLVCGNSLVGVRRQVYDSADLTGKSAQWFDVEPKPVERGSKRPAHTVYAFLVPQPGMLPYDDKYVRKLMKNMTVEKDGKLVETDCAKLIDAWKKEFIRPFDKSDVKLLEDLSDKLDELWELCEDEMRAFRNATTDRLDVFGRGDAQREDVPFREKEKLADEFATKRIFGSTPYRRIKAVADYWCALWFWPIEKAPFLPSREEYLAEIQFALTGGLVGDFANMSGSDDLLAEQIRAETLDAYNAVGPVDIDVLGDKIPRFAIVNAVAKEQRFLHWELEFADIFRDRGGFDLTIGNPPWIKLEWKEAGIISDHRPEFVIKKLSATRTMELRDEILEDFVIRKYYLKDYTTLSGQKSFLNAT